MIHLPIDAIIVHSIKWSNSFCAWVWKSSCGWVWKS